MTRFLKIVLILLIGVVVLGASTWGTLAIYYSDLDSASLRSILSGAFAVCGLATVIALGVARWRRRVAGGFVVLFAALLMWWSTIEPSNDREWQKDVAVLTSADIDGNIVTLHNIRNFDYRSETDFTPAYYDKTFDVRQLTSVDLIAVYWMGPAIAHTFVSFGFADGERVAVSIETRKEQGESYSTVQGFFKRYELMYIVADERDVIRVRTNYRKDPPETVHIYRVNGPIENGQRIFLKYMERVDALETAPEFYNTLTTNCTTTIWSNSEVNPEHVPFSWKILASGYVPEYLYGLGRLDSSLPFPDLQAISIVNKRAQAADQAADFTRLIRQGIPGMQPSKQPQ